jgi:putative transposase
MPYSRLFFHFIWSTKDRLPLITERNREPILAAIVSKTREMNGIVHAVNCTSDHVHLLATLRPTTPPSVFIGQVKGSSSHLASRLPDAAPFAWQAEYGVVTVSESHLPTIVRYIREQEQRHAHCDVHSVLERSSECSAAARS